ncbi:MAG: DUF4153 domain-containing protein [Clostridium sp.]|uniref:DUF4153 domain-containing protein n=1 Tax=Clostridium sp. TaxID=1506 RepID=UPI0030603831
MGISNMFNKGKNAIKESMKRFPIEILLSMATVIILIYMSEAEKWQWDDGLQRIAMVMALGIPVYLCIQLFLESKNKENEKSRIIYYGTSAILLIAYGWFLLKDVNMVEITRYVGFNLVFILGFLVIPYIDKEENFEIYVIRVLQRFFTTVVYSVVLYLGLAAILFTINYLLEIKIDPEIYYYTWLIIVGVFAPCFFLGGIPSKGERLSVKAYPKGLKVLMLYIIMPLISVYTVILYIYFGKIIITMNWPEGLVSHLVLWYGVISAVTIFLISAVSDQSQWVKKYINIFPKAILPLMGMMFVSMGIRINAYGITENRYFVLALGIWVFGVMIYFSASKKRKNIILPTSLAIIILVSVFGPLSSYSISKYSQNRRFEKIANRNNMVENGKVVKSTGQVSKEDQQEISSILHYFNNKHELKDVKYLPDNFKIGDIKSQLGIEDSVYYYGDNYEYFYFTVEESSKPIEIKEYDYLFDLTSYQTDNKKSDVGVTVNYNKASNKFIIYKDGKEIYSNDFNEYIKALVDKYGNDNSLNSKSGSIPSESMRLKDETDKVKVEFKFKNISGSKTALNGNIESKELQFYVFIKVK